VAPPVLVTGFLGAGKSRAARALAGLAAITEWPGLQSPAPGAVPVLAVADAANWARQMADDLAAPLIRAQIGAAAAVLIARADLVDAAPVRQALARLTDAAVLDGPDVDPAAVLAALRSGRPEGAPAVDLTDGFRRWEYRGPARLQADLAEALAADRPAGLYRLTGAIRTDRGGLAVEVTGQVRETRITADPGQTRLVGWGRRDRLGARDLDLWFGRQAAEAAARTGLFGHR